MWLLEQRFWNTLPDSNHCSKASLAPALRTGGYDNCHKDTGRCLMPVCLPRVICHHSISTRAARISSTVCPEVSIRYLLRSHSFLHFHVGSSLNRKYANSSRLAGQRAPGSSVSTSLVLSLRAPTIISGLSHRSLFSHSKDFTHRVISPPRKDG